LKNNLDIIYEDNHLLIVNKASGMLVQDDHTSDKTLLDLGKDYIKNTCGKPGSVFLGLVHRLDRPASGLVVLARTSKALTRMNEQFRNKTIDKIYWVITGKMPPAMEGKLIHWLIKNHQKNIVKAFLREKEGSVKAELEYRILGNIKSYFLLEVKLITGRFHQIRTQFSAAGCPVVGDVKYGYQSPNPDKSICLHARKLLFLHPVKRENIDLTAPLPSTHGWDFFKDYETEDSSGQ
jgi:23S rRNA pseudouridine1911/1915/1917 synthase